jgi:hypothetical protein
MVLSWALTGVIRYTFCATSLVGWEFAPLVWARYLALYVLYPIGASSEALVNLATLPISVWFSILPFAQWDAYALLRGVLFVVWWPGERPAVVSLRLRSLRCSWEMGGMLYSVCAYGPAAPSSACGRKAQEALIRTR